MRSRRDPIELEIFKNMFHSIAEEMGAALRRTAFSPNIKERRDYSCAVFDSAGNAIAMGDHMPVHLGSMPMSVRAAVDRLVLGPGDIAMLNDPFAGGTHLPDITMVMPVFVATNEPQRTRRTQRKTENKKVAGGPDFYVASRAHHADIGGTFAGSMGLCREIYQEGLRIPPVKLVRAGEMDRDILSMVLANVRTPHEREGDLGAQIAACNLGARRLREISDRYGISRVKAAAADLLDYSAEMMMAFLAQVPAGTYMAEDYLDDDGINDTPVKIAVTLTFDGKANVQDSRWQMDDGRWNTATANRVLHERLGRVAKRTFTPKGPSDHPSSIYNHPSVVVDFTGTSAQVEGSINAVEAITVSAVFYVFRCLLAEEVPATAGLMRPVRIIAPEGTVINARPPAAVAGGNVETSQRIVDVLLKALAQAMPDRIPAAASGTMNNLTIGGLFPPGDPRAGEPFAYYETIAGGMGARPAKDGVSGVHTHMTNSLNTPAEALAYAYPFRVTRYALRRGEVYDSKDDVAPHVCPTLADVGSGGAGKFRGGDGIVREIEVLTDAEVTILSDRRKRGPYGLAGGHDGQAGKTEIIRSDGTVEQLPSKGSARLKKGERVRVETPGGGGWGKLNG
jgi:N-methylhydantoinase B